ncbi:MAG TPA: hypothetical protein VFS15_07100 [Kofleriaceae bacterium]|nr:hypothetical protein [Kofleriaceae bacterium]
MPDRREIELPAEPEHEADFDRHAEQLALEVEIRDGLIAARVHD